MAAARSVGTDQQATNRLQKRSQEVGLWRNLQFAGGSLLRGQCLCPNRHRKLHKCSQLYGSWAVSCQLFHLLREPFRHSTAKEQRHFAHRIRAARKGDQGAQREMPSRKKLNWEKIREGLMLTCPHCKSRINHAECKRTDGEHLQCPRCEQAFIPKADALTTS